MKRNRLTIMAGILSYSFFVAVLFFIPSFLNSTVEVKERDFFSTKWLNDFKTALKLSSEQNLPILANFTGSDWCGVCIMMDQQVFNTKDFNQWAEGNVILLRIDYPETKVLPEAEKTQNEWLGRFYRIQEYPTNYLLNEKGDVLAKLEDGYNVKQWIDNIASKLSSISP